MATRYMKQNADNTERGINGLKVKEIIEGDENSAIMTVLLEDEGGEEVGEFTVDRSDVELR